MDLQNLSQIRELTETEIPQLNRLVSESFGYASPHSFFDDFPIWGSSRVKRLGIFSGDHLVSHVGIRFCEMKTSTGTIKVAMIGAVATAEKYRGNGLSTRLLKEACHLSEEQNCDWSLLWGSEHDFYFKFGFELHGEQFQAPLSMLEDLPENKIPQVKRGWHPKIFDLLVAAKNGISLYEEDRSWVSNHKTVNWFYHEEPFAFVGFERGLDLPHMIHEFGGDPDSLREIMAFILSLDIETTVLGTANTLLSLGFHRNVLIEEYLCLARPHHLKPDLVWHPDYWVSGLSAC